MDGNQDFVCMICQEYATDAVETLCCGQLMCQQCADDISRKFTTCPQCREHLAYKPSMISRRMISGIKVECQYECGIKIPHK